MCNRIYLPLYSLKGGIHVPEKSGLNLWNAGGRLRDPYEVYIPIYEEVYRTFNWFNEFFPDMQTQFCLILPNGDQIIAKICQEQNKSIMSNPNSALGRWIIGEIEYYNQELQNRNSPITYDMLLNSGFDSVNITRLEDNIYSICTAPIGSYEHQMGR